MRLEYYTSRVYNIPKPVLYLLFSIVDSRQTLPNYSMDALFENNSQDLNDYNEIRDMSTNTSLDLTDSSTQTNPTTDMKHIEIANEAFGTYIGHEINNVPLCKRRFVMYQIIKLI